jgi:hypothetical protein
MKLDVWVHICGRITIDDNDTMTTLITMTTMPTPVFKLDLPHVPYLTLSAIKI